MTEFVLIGTYEEIVVDADEALRWGLHYADTPLLNHTLPDAMNRAYHRACKGEVGTVLIRVVPTKEGVK